MRTILPELILTVELMKKVGVFLRGDTTSVTSGFLSGYHNSFLLLTKLCSVKVSVVGKSSVLFSFLEILVATL